MKLRTAALAGIAIALLVAACGGGEGIEVVSDDERDDRAATLARELDGDAGEREEDSGARHSEIVDVDDVGVSIEVLDLPCQPDEGFVRTLDARVGCAPIPDLDPISKCRETSRPVLDFLHPYQDDDSAFTIKCASFDDAPDEVLDDLAEG